MTTQNLDQVLSGQQLAAAINDNAEAARAAALFGRRRSACLGLAWGYYGGPTPHGYLPHGTVMLTASATNYVQADPADYVPVVNTVGFSTGFIPIRKLVTDSAGATTDSSEVIILLGAATGGPAISIPKVLQIAVSDETTPIVAGDALVTLRAPYAIALSEVRASLSIAQASGSIFTVRIKKNGTSILSTNITIDNAERTSTTAAVVAVISTLAIADDDEISVDVTQVGNGTATGLKVALIGT